jgi:hypothetical protein
VRLEVRKTGGAICRECGATELVREAANGAELVASLGPILEKVVAERAQEEHPELVESERRARAELEVGQEMIAERERTLEIAHEETIAKVRELAPEQAPRVRVFKRRWQRELQAAVDEVVAELLDRTRRA